GGGICFDPVSRARRRLDPLDRGGAAVDRLPRRALRSRRAGRLRLCGSGVGGGRGVRALARETLAGYACHTFRMMVRASLSGSWCEGMRTLTTSEAMNRTSGRIVVRIGRKIPV